ncbi:MAG: DMT family transporter [Acidimicrobiales bacterium]
MVACFALLAALANAVASICQRLGVEDAPMTAGPSMSLVRHMVRRPIWLLGFVIMAAGFASQAVALHLGALNVVQPLMVTELVTLVLVLWLWYATPLVARDLVAAVATAGGLGMFLFLAAPQVGARIPSDAQWLETGLSVVVVAAALTVLGSRGPGRRRALLLGAAASVGFALLAAVTKSMTDVLARGWGAVVTSWQLYALCVIGLTSFLIMQSAFQVGPFAASQSSLILVNPFVSIAVGHVLFGETLRGGPLFAPLEVLALITMIVGALGLSTSSLVAQVHDESAHSHLLRGRGRYARWRHEASRR